MTIPSPAPAPAASGCRSEARLTNNLTNNRATQGDPSGPSEYDTTPRRNRSRQFVNRRMGVRISPSAPESNSGCPGGERRGRLGWHWLAYPWRTQLRLSDLGTRCLQLEDGPAVSW